MDCRAIFSAASGQKIAGHPDHAVGLKVTVTGNDRAKEAFLAMRVERYLDYKKENYWEELSGLDYVIDTLGAGEFERELSVLKEGGRLLSLRTGPNKAFARSHHITGIKKRLFTLAGARYDKAARRQGKEYRFIFVRSDGAQLKKVTEIVEREAIRPAVDPRAFSLEQAAVLQARFSPESSFETEKQPPAGRLLLSF